MTKIEKKKHLNLPELLEFVGNYLSEFWKSLSEISILSIFTRINYIFKDIK